MLSMPGGCPECGATAGDTHVHPCSFQQRYEAAARSGLLEWLASLPAEYERLKARAAANAVDNDGSERTASGARVGR
jgi:hypothetical protein